MKSLGYEHVHLKSLFSVLFAFFSCCCFQSRNLVEGLSVLLGSAGNSNLVLEVGLLDASIPLVNELEVAGTTSARGPSADRLLAPVVYKKSSQNGVKKGLSSSGKAASEQQIQVKILSYP